MGSTTSPNGLRYPAGADAVTLATYLKNLADDTQASLPVVSNTAPTKVAGLVWYAPTAGTLQVTDGTSWFPLVAPPVWTALTGYAGGSAPRAGSFAPAWTVKPDGKIELRGQVQATTTFGGSGVVIFASLPAAIVPTKEVDYSVGTSFSSSDNPARVTITAAGALSFYGAVSQISWFSLDDISYYLS